MTGGRDTKGHDILLELEMGVEKTSLGASKGYEFSALSQQVIGAATHVRRELGAGFLEYTSHKALAVEMRLAGIDFQHEVDIPILLAR